MLSCHGRERPAARHFNSRFTKSAVAYQESTGTDLLRNKTLRISTPQFMHEHPFTCKPGFGTRTQDTIIIRPFSAADRKPACHAGQPGSIPGTFVLSLFAEPPIFRRLSGNLSYNSKNWGIPAELSPAGLMEPRIWARGVRHRL